MGYVYLALAIIFEVTATNALKASEEFTKMVPSAIVVVGYGASCYFLSRVLERMSVGTAYAIWAGMGIVLVAILAAVLFRQLPDLPAVIGMVLIISGVVVIHLFQKPMSIEWKTWVYAELAVP